jgi:PAS domain S-box-containing protein
MASKVYYASALYEVASSINSSLDLSQVLNQLAKSTTKAAHAKACSLRLLSPDKHQLIIGGAYGLSQAYLRKGSVEVEKSKIDQEALQGKAAIITDVTHDPRFQYPEEAKAELIRSILVVPLTLRDTPIGVLRLYTEELREFSTEEIGFVKAIANLGAIAIQNAKLYQALKEELGDLTEDINEMADRLHESRLQVARQMDALSYAKYRLETILASMGEGVVVTDTDYNVLLANTAAETLLGFHRQEAIGKNGDLILPLKKTELEPILASASVTKPLPPLVKKFGEKVLSVLVNPIRDERGQIFGAVSLLRDITEQAAIEEMKTEFISVVSHELRTPLTPIKGYIDLILEGDAGKITEEQASYLNIVQANTDRLVALVNGLLDISRIEAGKIDLDIEPVDMEALIHEVVSFHEKQIECVGLKVKVNFPSRLPWVKADRGRITQILNNLITNAYKYTPCGGTITVSAFPNVEFLEVVVADTGVGISREDQKKLFTRFFRVENPATREASGTGLGLAIVKSIVEKLEGEIWVESQLGKGSAFHFTLPLVEPGPRKAKSRAHPRPASRKILLVNDEVTAASLIEGWLRNAGYKVYLAENGDQAIRRAADYLPDLIIVDIQASALEVFEAIRGIKDNPLTAEIPVVVFSMIQDEEQAGQLGLIEYLSEPPEEAELLRMVERILSQGRKVLVHDSDLESRQLLEEVLTQKGYVPIFAKDGLDLLVQARKERPVLILMDLQLSDMDGYEVLRRLNRRPETIDIPVIVMTDSPHETLGKVIAVGADDLVRRPLDIEALLVEIERMLQNVKEWK